MSRGAPVGALLLGAGRGERLGHALPKAFVPLRGRTLIERSAQALSASGVIDWIQPVLAATEVERFHSLALGAALEAGAATELGAAAESGSATEFRSETEFRSATLGAPVVGGQERQDSMSAGLAALPAEIEYVAVHDAARCLVSPRDLRAVVTAAQESEGAAILGERSRDTLKQVVDGRITATPERSQFWAAQTPQVVRRDWLVEAAEAASAAERNATDDAQLVEWLGHPVQMVEAMDPNPKITRPEDLVWAEMLLAERESSI